MQIGSDSDALDYYNIAQKGKKTFLYIYILPYRIYRVFIFYNEPHYYNEGRL